MNKTQGIYLALIVYLLLRISSLLSEIAAKDVQSLTPEVLADALIDAPKNFPDLGARRLALNKAIPHYKDLILSLERDVTDLNKNIQFNKRASIPDYSFRDEMNELNNKKRELIQAIEMIIMLYQKQLNYLHEVASKQKVAPDYIEIEKAHLNIASYNAKLEHYKSEMGYSLQAQLAVGATIAALVGAGAYIYRKFFRKKQGAIKNTNNKQAFTSQTTQ